MRLSWFASMLALVVAAAQASLADTLKLKGGQSIDCTVLRESPDKVTIIYGHGLVTISSSMVDSVERAKPAEAASTTATGAARLPGWEECVKRLAEEKWATELQQVPATVIDAGVMRNVPYKSFHCGRDYELNVYGDPDAPAAVELGLVHGATATSEAQARCVAFVSGLLKNAADRKTVETLKMTEDVATREGVTFEVTPPTAADAYGGWWVSVYSTNALDSVRATEAELKEIAVAKAAVAAKPVKDPTGAKKPAATDRPAIDDWKGDDLRNSRPSVAADKPTAPSGRVYVRGYYRKDGTYVRPHTRSAPRKR